MIDKNWRAFLNGKEIIFIKALIQETFDEFFQFAKSKDLYEGDPYLIKAYELGISSRDFQGIQPLYSQVFNFKYTHSRSGKTESIQTNVIKLNEDLKKVIGYKEFNERLNVGEPVLTKLESYTKFFAAARSLGFHRNTDSHKKFLIEDTGHALAVASDVMTIIELAPIVIRDQNTLADVRKVLKRLLEDIIIKEDPSQSAFTDDESVDNNLTNDNLISSNITQENFEEKYHDVNAKLDLIVESLEDNKIATFTIAELIQELQPSSNSADQIEKIRAGIQLNQENIELILEKQQAEIEEETMVKAENLNPEEEKIEKLIKFADAVSSPLNPSKMIKFAKELKDDSKLKKSHQKSKTQTISKDDVIRPTLLTPQQAIHEMQQFQKKFKQEFTCKNWENIAQGPFRQVILEEKILSSNQFLKNPFIKQRYESHTKIMDDQINSNLGKEFFDLLGSVLY